MGIIDALVGTILSLFGLVLIFALLTGIVAIFKHLLVFWIEMIREIKDLFRKKEY